MHNLLKVDVVLVDAFSLSFQQQVIGTQGNATKQYRLARSYTTPTTPATPAFYYLSPEVPFLLKPGSTFIVEVCLVPLSSGSGPPGCSGEGANLTFAGTRTSDGCCFSMAARPAGAGTVLGSPFG